MPMKMWVLIVIILISKHVNRGERESPFTFSFFLMRTKHVLCVYKIDACKHTLLILKSRLIFFLQAKVCARYIRMADFVDNLIVTKKLTMALGGPPSCLLPKSHPRLLYWWRRWWYYLPHLLFYTLPFSSFSIFNFIVFFFYFIIYKSPHIDIVRSRNDKVLL